MGITGAISRVTLYGTNTTEVHGLDGFLELIDKRQDIESRTRGLITGESVPAFLWLLYVLNSSVNQFQITSACTYVSQF